MSLRKCYDEQNKNLMSVFTINVHIENFQLYVYMLNKSENLNMLACTFIGLNSKLICIIRSRPSACKSNPIFSLLIYLICIH